MLKLMIGVILLGVTHAAYGQAGEQPKAFLGYQVDEWLNWNLSGGELLLEHVELIRQPETKIAIRVCTKLPLAEAISQSKAPPFRIANFFTGNHGYTPERLLYLRSKECYRGKGKISAIEVWVIPKGATPPPAADTLKVKEAERIYVKRGGRVSKAYGNFS